MKRYRLTKNSHEPNSENLGRKRYLFVHCHIKDSSYFLEFFSAVFSAQSSIYHRVFLRKYVTTKTC